MLWPRGRPVRLPRREGDTRFFLTSDYAFGHSLQENATHFVEESDGKVRGSVRFSFGSPDFSSFLLQAQASKVKVIGLAMSGADLLTAVKQAREFGIVRSGQSLASLPDAYVGLRLLASSEQSAALEDGLLDLGFMMSTVSLPPLEKIAISRERLVALVPASHRWARRKSISLSELVTTPLVIGTEGRWRGFRSLLRDLVDARGMTMTFAEEADDLPVLLQLVRSGFGCTILDASFIPTLPPGIRPVEIEDVTATLDVALTWHQDNLSPLAGRFIDVARRIASASQSRSTD
jgi:hypothetical protein